MDTETSLDRDNKEETDEDITIYKMSFIYKALLNGWKVKMMNDNTFEFTNNNKSIKKQYILHNFLENFVNSNI
jgi:hypothetical protein